MKKLLIICCMLFSSTILNAKSYVPEKIFHMYPNWVLAETFEGIVKKVHLDSTTVGLYDQNDAPIGSYEEPMLVILIEDFKGNKYCFKFTDYDEKQDVKVEGFLTNVSLYSLNNGFLIAWVSITKSDGKIWILMSEGISWFNYDETFNP